MPRLSLYRPQKGNDYKFIDKTAWEMFQIGGTDVLIHKYLGPDGTGSQGASPTTPTYAKDDIFNIQDLLFLENRDRKYDPNVYVLRGVYSIQDIDFNLSQFGLFLQNDTIFITFHINDTVEKLGRKLVAGDVIELPHLKDEYALNDMNYALKRYYVIEDVNRAAEGFSVTWYPHLYRAKCKPLVDSQEFKQILDEIANSEAFVGSWEEGVTYQIGDIVEYEGKKYTVLDEVKDIPPPNSDYYKLADSLKDLMSTYNKEMQITNAVLDQAEADAPKSGYDTSKYFTLETNEDGSPEIVTVDDSELTAALQTKATDENGNFIYKDPWDPDKNYQVDDILTYEGKKYKVIGTNPMTGVTHNIIPPNGLYYELIGDVTDEDAIYLNPSASTVEQTPENSGYPGYLVGDGEPPNGSPFTSGIAFPVDPITGQYCLRTDFMPKRLFRFNGAAWLKVEDDVRMTMSNTDTRNTYKTGFINNTEKSNFDKFATDTFFVNATTINNPGPDSDYNLPVVSVNYTSTREIYVITNIDYTSTNGLEVYVNEHKIKAVMANENGKTAFTVKTKIKEKDKIEWDMYRDSMNQKQSLHKALRPEADE